VTEAEWLDCRDVVQQNAFLMTKGRARKLQLFLCACCRRADDLLPDDQRRRVSRMASFLTPQPGRVVGDVWQVCRHAVEVAERFAEGLATDSERREAARAAQAVFNHYGEIASSGPFPGEDPAAYDDAAVKIGGDAAAAADCAASALPAAAERAVRVAATSAAYDSEGYYAGAHGDPDVAPDHPHLLARRAERAAQWKLLLSRPAIIIAQGLLQPEVPRVNAGCAQGFAIGQTG
jgi:hypothetical protein